MQLALAVEHHDQAYLKKRGGAVLYSHLRGAPGRCRYRRRAIERGLELYRRGVADSVSTEELSGLALLVMQRAHLAAEDLGGLLHTFAERPSWERLSSVGLAELDAVYQGAAAAPETSLATFLLPTPESIEGHAHLSEIHKRALHRLVAWAEQRTVMGLETVAAFWLRHRPIAKCTMHGFPVVTGSLVFGPPPAGRLAEGVRDPQRDPWALAVLSKVDHRKNEVITDRFIEPLDHRAVRGFASAGTVAVKLTERLSSTQADTIERGYRYSIPLELSHRLAADEQAALRELDDDDQ